MAHCPRHWLGPSHATLVGSPGSPELGSQGHLHSFYQPGSGSCPSKVEALDQETSVTEVPSMEPPVWALSLCPTVSQASEGWCCRRAGMSSTSGPHCPKQNGPATARATARGTRELTPHPLGKGLLGPLALPLSPANVLNLPCPVQTSCPWARPLAHSELYNGKRLGVDVGASPPLTAWRVPRTPLQVHAISTHLGTAARGSCACPRLPTPAPGKGSTVSRLESTSVHTGTHTCSYVCLGPRSMDRSVCTLPRASTLSHEDPNVLA